MNDIVGKYKFEFVVVFQRIHQSHVQIYFQRTNELAMTLKQLHKLTAESIILQDAYEN